MVGPPVSVEKGGGGVDEIQGHKRAWKRGTGKRGGRVNFDCDIKQ